MANMICPADAFSFYLNYFLLHKKWDCSLCGGLPKLAFRLYVAALLVDPRPGYQFFAGK